GGWRGLGQEGRTGRRGGRWHNRRRGHLVGLLVGAQGFRLEIPDLNSCGAWLPREDLMNEDELREFVRATIAQKLGPDSGAPYRPPGESWGRQHASHFLLPVPAGSDEDGACRIEPNVRCNHCGYCLSYGH